MKKKVFLLVLLISMVAFLVIKQRRELVASPRKKQVKLSRQLPEVKNKKIIDELARENIDSKEELRDQLAKVSERDIECKKNDLLFLNPKFNSKNIQAMTEDLFQKTIVRPQAEAFYLKLMEILDSKKEINIEVVFGILRTLEICRYPNSLAFFDKIIESKELKISKLLEILNNGLLGNHFSSINLALVFGKISKIYYSKLISSEDYQEIGELKERFLKSEKEFTENLTKSENLDIVRELTVEHLEELRDFGLLLKGELENLSKN